MREITLLAVDHPVSIQKGSIVFARVDSPLADKFGQGDPTANWAGDTRLALYWDTSLDLLVLMRLEHDNEYRPVCWSAPGALLNEETVNRLIARLVAHDTRHGFDPVAAVVKSHDAVERAKRSRMDDWIAEVGPKLLWGLRRDGLT